MTQMVKRLYLLISLLLVSIIPLSAGSTGKIRGRIIDTEGQWKDDELHGKGKITYLKDIEDQEKGTIMKGNLKKGNFNGLCEIIYPDGEILDCMYVNGKRTKAKFRGEKKWHIYKR